MRERNINRSGTASVKHIPQRTCVACRQIKAKRELVRVVHTSNGIIEIDGSGKKTGRGAYLCQALDCWEAGLKGNKLEHALRSSVSKSDRERLLGEAQELFKGADK